MAGHAHSQSSVRVRVDFHFGKTGSVGADMSYRISTTAVLPNGMTCKKCIRPYHFAGVCRREGQPPPSGKGTTSRGKSVTEAVGRALELMVVLEVVLARRKRCVT